MDIMAESKKDYLNKKDESGEVKISEHVISSIASLATSEVDGVDSLASPNADFVEKLGKKSTSKGVRVNMDDKYLVVDIFILLKYGAVIPDVSKKIQQDVSAAIESMTGFAVSEVNVHITGISFEKPKKAKA